MEDSSKEMPRTCFLQSITRKFPAYGIETEEGEKNSRYATWKNRDEHGWDHSFQPQISALRNLRLMKTPSPEYNRRCPRLYDRNRKSPMSVTLQVTASLWFLVELSLIASSSDPITWSPRISRLLSKSIQLLYLLKDSLVYTKNPILVKIGLFFFYRLGWSCFSYVSAFCNPWLEADTCSHIFTSKEPENSVTNWGLLRGSAVKCSPAHHHLQSCLLLFAADFPTCLRFCPPYWKFRFCKVEKAWKEFLMGL